MARFTLDGLLNFVTRTVDPASPINGDAYYLASGGHAIRVRLNGVWANVLDSRGIDAATITTGTIADARLAAAGTGATNVARGNHDHEGVNSAALDAAAISTGTFSSSRIPNLDAGKITTGTFSLSRIPNMDAAHINGLSPVFSSVEIDGALNHDGSTVGFYGSTPISRPNIAEDLVNGSAESTYNPDQINTIISDIISIRNALKNLGLCS